MSKNINYDFGSKKHLHFIRTIHRNKFAKFCGLIIITRYLERLRSMKSEVVETDTWRFSERLGNIWNLRRQKLDRETHKKIEKHS